MTALAALDLQIADSSATDLYGRLSAQVQSCPAFDATRASGMTLDGSHATGNGLQQLLGLSAAAWEALVENGIVLRVPMEILHGARMARCDLLRAARRAASCVAKLTEHRLLCYP